MSALHVRFWLLAGLGILLDGFDLFIIGVANPLIKKDFHATATQVGLVSSAAIVGAVVGAGVLGPLGDRLGRCRIFQFDLVLFVVGLSALSVGARRLHDTDKSGWLLLLGLIPFIGGIIVLVLLVLPGTPSQNRFG